MARAVGRRCSGVIEFWIGARRDDLPRRQPAHQAGRVLGVADPRGADASIPDDDVPGRGVHAPEDDEASWPRPASPSPTPTSPGATTKPELAEYLTEITQPPVAEYFRGNLWPNTPDILHERSAARRPARVPAAPGAGRHAVVASTASTAATSCARTRRSRPAPRSTCDSEKYELKVRDWDAPGQPRRLHHARQPHPAREPGPPALSEPALLRRRRRAVSGTARRPPQRDDVMFVAVNLDPFATHAAMVERADPRARHRARPAVPDARAAQRRVYEWRGPRGFVELDPARDLAQIFVLRR